MKKITILMFLLGALFMLGCGRDTIGQSKIKTVLFDNSGEHAYTIEGIEQSISGLKDEYTHYINLNYPSNLKKLAMASAENWKEFIDRREKQDMVIVEALKNDVNSDPVYNYFLRQGMRDAIVKAYLYKSIPNVEKMKDAQFSDDRAFLEKIYQENKKSYDDKNISREEAIESLKNVYLKKKRAVIDYVLQQEQAKIITKLQKEFKIVENPQIATKKPEYKPETVNKSEKK